MSSVEIESIEAFERVVADPPSVPVVVQGLDLSGRATGLTALLDRSMRVVLFGCALDDACTRAAREKNAIVVPALPDLPVAPFRPALYTAEELFAGIERGYDETVDAHAYRWFKEHEQSGDLLAATAQALHDASISDALEEALAGARVAGVMGGHALLRGTPEYAQAVRLGQGLADAGFVVATGGGPGAMEAANLGGYLCGKGPAAVEEACGIVAHAPSYKTDPTSWARTAFDARRAVGAPTEKRSVGIPTWFYGHEPPNAFGVQIAKYFQNAVREDGLLARANAGIVFLPGAAGTVQEIFQDATQSYYASPGFATTMVLVNKHHWTEKLPAWQLLCALAKGKEMEKKIHLVDHVDEALAIVAASAP
jgi:predicted Rossmann-fold nucleotide-binding protein